MNTIKVCSTRRLQLGASVQSMTVIWHVPNSIRLRLQKHTLIVYFDL